MSRPRTIWLASYPKSGNTWTRALLTALTRTGPRDDDHGDKDDLDLDLEALGHGPIASARGLLERHLGFASSDLTREEVGALRPLADAALDATLTEVRFRKVHDGLHTGPGGAPIVPVAATRGAVCIVRDPRDVAVSYAHHVGTDVERAVRRLGRETSVEGDVRHLHAQFPEALGTWSEHVTGWMEHDHFPVLLVRYEDLHADTARELRRIATFAELEVGDAAIDNAVEAARFDRLQAKEAASGFGERPRREAAFFRRGRSGGWRDELAPELARRVEEDHHEVMERLGYAVG